MKKTITASAIILISIVACEKTVDIEDSSSISKYQEAIPEPESPTYESLQVKRAQLDYKIQSAKRILYPHRGKNIEIKIKSESEQIQYKADNPPQ